MSTSSRYPTYPYSFTIGRPTVAPTRTRSSPTEMLHLSVAFVVLTFDLAILFYLHSVLTLPVLELVVVAAVAALTGFLAHELAHKVTAQRRGYWAEFRLSPVGLLISVITAFAGILLAAPGATLISGMGDPRDWGRTSLAGPWTNFGFGIAFLSGAFVTHAVGTWSWLASPLLFLAFINGWFAAFNMIPLGPLDGAKVYRWDREVWVATFLTFAVLAGALYYLYYVGLPRL